MGKLMFDQYSLVHFSTGVIAYFFNISLKTTIILHTIFELSENTEIGMRFINTYFAGIWPGGKPYADSFINNIGDSVSVIIGWLVAYYLDLLSIKYGWYDSHLVAL